MESPSNEDSVNLILDDLESLQGLLDEELAALNIPLLDDVVDPDQKAAFEARLDAATMELDFDEFIVEEELPEGLGLDLQDDPPESITTPSAAIHPTEEPLPETDVTNRDDMEQVDLLAQPEIAPDTVELTSDVGESPADSPIEPLAATEAVAEAASTDNQVVPDQSVTAEKSPTSDEEQLVLPPVADLNAELGLTAAPGTETMSSAGIDSEREELIANLVDQCLLEVMDLLQPRLEQLCRELVTEALAAKEQD